MWGLSKSGSPVARGGQEERVAFVDQLWNAAEVTRATASTNDPAGGPHSSLVPPVGTGLEEPSPASSRAARWLLIAALAIGLVRFVRLAHWSLWIDEALTWTDWHHGLVGGEIKNPLGYTLIAWVVNLFGGVADELSLRILPAVVGWVAVALTYVAFRPWSGRMRAAAAALLVAASSWHVYWSQNARFYTLAQAVSLLGASLVLRGLMSGSVVRTVVGLAIAALAAAFHPSAGLLLPALVLAPFALRLLRVPLPAASRRAERALLVAGLLGAAAGASWALETWRMYVYQKGQGSTLAEAASSAAHFAKTTGFFVTPVLGTACLFGAWFAWRRRESTQILLFLVVATCLGLGLLASLVVRVSAQYVFFLLPWIVALACAPLASGETAAVASGETAAGAEENTARSSRESLRGAAGLAYLSLLVVPALVTTGLYFTVRAGERPQRKEAYDFVWNARADDDLVLGMAASVGEFYLSPHNTDLRHPEQVGWLDYFHARLPQEWARYPRRAWFIVNPEEFLDWDPGDAERFQRMLREQCRLVKAWPLYVESRDLSVWVYLKE
jgi:mannosyltransferase